MNWTILLTIIFSVFTVDGLRTLKVTARDELVAVYIDGEPVTNLPNAKDPSKVDIIPIPPGADVIGLVARRNTSNSTSWGIVASVGDTFVTDDLWRCSSDAWVIPSWDTYYIWMMPYFIGYMNWLYAAKFNMPRPREIVQSARWIRHTINPYDPYKPAKPTNNITYCRANLKAKRLAITGADNVSIWVDGIKYQRPLSDKKWDQVSSTPLSTTADVIAVQVDHTSNDPAGLVGSVGDWFVTDSTWKCTNQFMNGWFNRSFNDSNWPSAKAITGLVARGVAGISRRALWIWTSNTNDRTIYCRARIDCSREYRTLENTKMSNYDNDGVFLHPMNEQTMTEPECRDSCNYLQSCHGYRVASNDSCELYTYAYVLSPCDNCTSYKVVDCKLGCKSGWTTVVNVALTGNRTTLPPEYGTNNVSQCKEACEEVAECVGVTFNNTGPNCTLVLSIPEGGPKAPPASSTNIPAYKITRCAPVVDGNWGSWTEGKCNLYPTCSMLTQWGRSRRTRVCNNPEPSGGGVPCDGNSSVVKQCKNICDVTEKALFVLDACTEFMKNNYTCSPEDYTSS